MADKKNTIMQKFNSADVTANDVIGLVDKYQAKHGKIKVPGNKKLTKVLKKTCAHHVYTGKGKSKNTLKNEGNNKLRCAACGNVVHVAPPTTKDDDEKLYRTFYNFFDELEYMMVEAGAADEDITKVIIFMKLYLKKIFKTNERVKEQLAKNRGKKKDKKKNGGNTSSTITSWVRK